MNSKPDGQKTRSIATQKVLMLAAEKLIAEKGIHNVSIREIVNEAGQKNESALQYHFKNLQGLLNAIHAERNQQTQEKRTELLDELLSGGAEPGLRDLCRMMVLPTFLLARADPKFRRYIAGFAHEIALTEDSALSRVSKSGAGGESGLKTGELLRTALRHLDERAYRQRMEFAVRLSSISMGNQAKKKQAFRGAEADLFLTGLLDALEGLLSSPVSKETKAVIRSNEILT